MTFMRNVKIITIKSPNKDFYVILSFMEVLYITKYTSKILKI